MTADPGRPDRGIVSALLRLSALPHEDWETSIQQILRVDSEVLGVDRVSYWSLRREPAQIHCEMGYVAGMQAFERGSVLLAVEHPSYFKELESTVVGVEDTRTDPRTADLQEYLRAREITAMLDIPVRTRGAVVGVLCHEHSGAPRHWTESDMSFAMGVAQTVAAALEARARGDAEQKEREAALLDRASRRLAAERSVRAVADAAMDVAVPELADWGVLDLLEGGRMVRVGLRHCQPKGQALLEELTRRYPPERGGRHATARVLSLRQSVLLPELDPRLLVEVAVDMEHARLIEALGVRSVMGVPILRGNEAIGALLLQSFSGHYTSRDLSVAEGIAHRIAAAVENARLHQKAQEAIEARDEFIALAAHELHGPLASLQLAAESLATGVASSPRTAERMAGTVVRQTQALSRFVDHMLDTSRIMVKRLALRRQQVDLSELVTDVARRFAPRLERAGSSLDLRIEPEVRGCWDADRLGQVVQNLVDNAVKFGASKPIQVSLRRERDAAVLSVRDRGIGITPERLPTVFDPFARAVSPRSFGGLGLGLYIAKAVVEAHDGAIAVESRPGEGSTFTVRLPAEPEPCGAGEAG